MKTSANTLTREVAPFVDGSFVESASKTDVEVINPSDGKRLFFMPRGCQQDVNWAVDSARRAFSNGCWSDAPPSFRKKILLRFADLITSDAEHLDAMDAQEMGKPVSTLAFNATAAADWVRFNAEAVDKVVGDVYASDRQSLAICRRMPRGVVAAVVPWNFPTFTATLKVAPALAAGNCAVLKPSELAPSSALRVAELAMEAGLPKGVLNVVPGLGETVGRTLGLHMDVDMVAFTGSTEVGKAMLQYSGQSNMKVVVAECGGKSPQIVFADGVDLDAASASIAEFLLTNQGQICSVGSRLLVHKSIEDAMIEKIVAQMERITMGDARDPNTTFGPVASSVQCERVMHYIQSATADGALLAKGGRRVRAETGGYFVEPTVFRNVSPAARIAREEIFGPVLSVIPFKDEEEAIHIANDTVYGLAAYIWTTNISTGMKVAKSIRSMVFVNAVAPAGEGPGFAASWEAGAQSGVGKEGGLGGLESYFYRQLVWFSHA